MLDKKENLSKEQKNNKSEKSNISTKKDKSKIISISEGNKSKNKDPNILIIDDKNPAADSIKEIKREKFNKKANNIFTKIDSNIQGDLDICEINDEDCEEEYCISLNDSLEQPKQQKDKKGINTIIISRNSFNKTKNKLDNTNKKEPIFKYPNLFDDIINNNLTNKTYNKINKTEDQIFKEIIIKKRNNLMNSPEFWSAYSTVDRTKSKNKNYNENISMITNNEVVEFNYEDDGINIDNNINNNINKTFNNINKINNTISNSNTSFNVLNKETITENMNILFAKKIASKELKNSNSYKELKNWLDSINLSQYFDNFIQSDIYDINKLIEQMKYSENKLNYDDIESLLKIHKPGHIYRIFLSLQISSGLIDSNVSNFLIDKNIRHKRNKSKNNLKISISQEIKENNSCISCFKINFLNSCKKNDLNQFLLRYNLTQFYQNFYHNGFDLINFVILQMFSIEPINEIILENCFHLYDSQNREKVLKSLLSEKEKINYFLNSSEYLKFNEKYNIKYEDIIFEKNGKKKNDDTDNLQYEKIIIPNNAPCSDCKIF